MYAGARRALFKAGFGPELHTNPGLPFTFTGDDPDGFVVLNETAPDPEVTERDSDQGNAGIKTVGGALNFYSTVSAFNPRVVDSKLTIGKRYRYTTTISKVVSGALRHGDQVSNSIISTVGTHVLEQVAQNSSTILQSSGAGVDVTVTYHSVKEVL